MWVLLLDDYVEKIPPLWEHCFGSSVCFCITKPEGWTKAFLDEIFMTDSSLGVYSNCLAVPEEEPSHVSTSSSLGALGECLVVGFVGGILPAART
jgi:hypothetical protein